MSAPANITPLPVEPPPAKPRVKKLRLVLLLVPLAALAVVSTVFGMMMAVASDLPQLENDPHYRGQGAQNSVLYDAQGKPLGLLTSNQNRIFVRDQDISQYMRAAIISIEDRRFLSNNGVDLKGIGRAFVNDVVRRGGRQGGSTITQQFVKNALEAQEQRTLFQKLREAALAYHLTRKWGKTKILREYLNSIYFGNGAYGIEAASRAYFSHDANHLGCGTARRPCAKELAPHEAALLAGVVANPTAFDPVAHPIAAKRRRDMVLRKMLDQRYLSPAEYAGAIAESLPADVRLPSVDSKAPYFTTWVRQQMVDRYGARRAFEGGLKIRTTLDLDLQRRAQQAVNNYLAAPGGPTAALVAIDNQTGEVRAMVGGRNYDQSPFNLATQGQRQPGSSIKPFILAEAFREGIGPGSVWPSRKREFCVHRTKAGCREAFVVNNFEGSYTGQRTLANALTYSDNSVFATVGIKLGTKKISRLARRMGIRTPVSTNPAMTLGGLKEGVTPLDMAHAYETFQQGGVRVMGTLGAGEGGPVGIRWVEGKHGKLTRNRRRTRRVLPHGVAEQTVQVMTTVVKQGSGKRADIGQFAAGKTGTTENSGDAWFVGFTDRLTVAVWVGYPDKLKPMETEFQGGPVEGGTFPALIWRDFLLAANKLLDDRVAAERRRKGLPPLDTTTTPAPPPVGSVPPEGAAPTTVPTTPATPLAPTTPAPAQDGTGGAGAGTGAGGTGAGTQTPTPPPPATPAPTPTPAPPPQPPPGGGDGAGGTGAAGGPTPGT
jgi:penicillin-binding protein 1A